MDQYSRCIPAWSLTRQRTAAVTCAVLAQAARRRPARGVIFQGHRGSEYMGAPFCARVAQLGRFQSASVRGSGDDAHVESFFHSLKAEVTRVVTFLSEQTLRAQLRRSMRYYNTSRFTRAFASPEPSLPLASCLRTTGGVNHECQQK